MPTTPFDDIGGMVRSTASQFGVDPQVAWNVASRESGLNQSARSPVGAIGVMQLMPETARGLGVNPTDTHQNITGGVKYLKQMYDRYGHDWRKALAAYNAGPGAVDKAIFDSAAKLSVGFPGDQGDAWLAKLPTETQRYVQALAPSLTGPVPPPHGLVQKPTPTQPAPAKPRPAPTQHPSWLQQAESTVANAPVIRDIAPLYNKTWGAPIPFTVRMNNGDS